MSLQRRVARPNDTQLKRDLELREQIRVACKAVLDAPAPDEVQPGSREDDEYQRILDLRQLLPR